MTSSTDSYRLVVFQAPDQRDQVRSAIAKILGIHTLDAQRLVAHMPGILPGLYNAQTCRQLLEVLFQYQIPAEARLLDQFPDLNRPKQIYDMVLTAGGLNFLDQVHKQTAHFLPWDQVGMIATARVEVPNVVTEYTPPGITRSVVYGVRRMMGGGALNRKERVVHSPVSPKGEAIIWRKRPHAAFRLSEDKLRYDILGDHLAETATENFPKLIRWLCGGAGDAFLSKGTEALISKTPDDIPVFPDLESFTENVTMELLRSWYRKDRDAAAETEI